MVDSGTRFAADEAGADSTATHWLDAAVATATAFSNLGGGSSASNGWRRVAQKNVVIGGDITSLDFNISGLAETPGPPDVVTLVTGADNVGVIIADAPGLSDTPTNTREGNGVITYASPPTGTKIAALYIKCSTTLPDSVDVVANYAWKVASLDKL